MQQEPTTVSAEETGVAQRCHGYISGKTFQLNTTLVREKLQVIHTHPHTSNAKKDAAINPVTMNASPKKKREKQENCDY